MNKPRYYVDTSVIGGCFDDEFRDPSTALIDMARNGKIVLVISDVLAEELAPAPPEVQTILPSIPVESR